MTLVTTDLTAQEYGQRVRGHLGAAVAGFIAAGQTLQQAKDDPNIGGYGRMPEVYEAAGIHERFGQRLMAIARHPTLSNPTHVSELPTGWSTLYELSRLEPGDVEQAIADGAIRPDTTRDDVHALRTRLEELDRETRNRRERFTERLDQALSVLPSLVEHAEVVRAEWLPEAATYFHLPHQGHWFTAEGLRELADRLFKLADHLERDPL